jgi:putative glutamine amidotransferase
MSKRPVIGVTLDSEQPGGYSKYPWYALRRNYLDAVAAVGGLPVAVPHDAALAGDYLGHIDALVVTGGAFEPSYWARWSGTCRCWAFAAASNCSRWRWAEH